MFRSILYSVGLSYLFRKFGGRGGGYGGGYGRSRPFGRRW
jgi:hypothetical protein